MDYAVVVYFDKRSDQYISKVINNICESGVNSYMLDIGIRPHITLAAFTETNPEEFEKWLETYACEAESIKIHFSSIGVFPANHSVLFLSPVVEEVIIELHKSFNEKVREKATGFESYYLPGNWVPHCTLATRLTDTEVHMALDAVIAEFKPFDVSVAQIGFVQCNPFKEIGTYDTGSKSE